MNLQATESVDSCDKAASDAAELQSLPSLSVMKLADSVRLDEKVEFVSKSRQLMNGDPARDRFSASKLLQACCAFDAVECAAALLDGEVGAVPLVNERDSLTGLSPLHSASEAHACYCVKLLLKRRARTDLRSRDGRAQLPLELSLNSTRMEVTWNPDDHSVEDLVVLLNEKDLTAVKLLTEKTKEIGEVALASAIGGKIVALAALLIVAADKVNEAILCANGADKGSKENGTVYEFFIREALSTRSDVFAKKAGRALSEAELEQKRKLLLCEIELLQLFGATALSPGPSTEKKLPPLIRAIQAGDEAVVKLLLETNDVTDADSDGNSALHWCLKASWSSTSQQLKILLLLLKYGALVNRKDKLERTAFHIAASKGNSKALQVLLLEDPDGINYKTIMKETPIFFAARNDHIECVEKLLHWGANSEVLNLRKERPIDLAKSQDMRFMLSPTNINFIRSACSVQHMRAANFQCHDETLSMTEEDGSMDRNFLSAKAEVCKYFEGPGGCVRGTKCIYAHGQEELKKMNQGMHIIQSPETVEFRRKIFVGGLPLSLDSDALGQFFEEQFGSVEYAHIMKVQVGNELHSRGFGFVTFKNEMSANEAVKVQYVTITGKQVEIKSAIRKCFFLDKPQNVSVQDVQEHDGKCLQKMEALHPGDEMPRSEAAEDTKNKQTPWMDTLLNTIPKSPSGEVESHEGLCSVTQKSPPWVRAFRKWLPGFLKEATENMNGAKYPLSSLKADFKAAFGRELDHASLGYLKLSEFIQKFSDLCRVEFMQRGGTGACNHMVLFPRGPRTSRPPSRSPPSNSPFCDKSAAETADAFKCMKDLHPSSLENFDISSENNQMLYLPQDGPQKNSELEDTSILPLRFLEFLQPYEFQPQARESMEYGNQLSHSVLQSHAELRNISSFFLREFDFHHAYRKIIEQGKCFGCRQRNLLWANFPCGHLLWCTDCKIKAAHAAIGSEHKCVVCDMKVDRFILISSGARIQPWHGNFRSHMEIPQPNAFRTEVAG